MYYANGFSAPKTGMVPIVPNKQAANYYLHRCGWRELPGYDCGAPVQTINHIIKDCPLHRYRGNLLRSCHLFSFTEEAAQLVKNLSFVNLSLLMAQIFIGTLYGDG